MHANIWCDDDALTDFDWPSDIGDSDWLPDPDELRRQAMSFARGTSYGSDGIHPRQFALLRARRFSWTP